MDLTHADRPCASTSSRALHHDVSTHAVHRCDEVRESAVVAPSGAWVVDADGMWFREPGGIEVSVRHRLMLARLLAVLAERRATRPGEATSTRDLVAHVWSGARLVGDSGGNRLRVAVATLRKMGLERLLLHRRDGYLLDAAVVVRVVRQPSAAA